MSEVVTKRLLTDETGQLLVTALNSIAASCKPDATEINMGPNDDTKVATQINSLSEQIGNYIDSGICKRLTSGTAVKSVSQNGRYYAVNAPDTPSGVSQSGFLDVYVFADGYKRLIYHPVDVSSVYVTSAYGGTWKEWQQLAAGTEFNTVAISTLSALQTYLDNMPVGKTSTLILSGEASSTICGSTYISNATVTKIDNGFADLRWSRANENAGVARYQKASQTFRSKHHANVIVLQKTSVSVGQKSSWDSVYSEIENGYAGIVIIHFQNGANITGLVYKNNASYGSILGTTDDDSNPYFYAVKNGTSVLRRLAYST